MQIRIAGQATAANVHPLPLYEARLYELVPPRATILASDVLRCPQRCEYPLTGNGLYEIMDLMHVRRFWVAGVVLAASIALLPFPFHPERHLETATRVEGSEAESVRQELASRFRSPFVDRVVLVIQGLPPADSEEGEKAFTTFVA